MPFPDRLVDFNVPLNFKHSQIAIAPSSKISLFLRQRSSSALLWCMVLAIDCYLITSLVSNLLEELLKFRMHHHHLYYCQLNLRK